MASKLKVPAPDLEATLLLYVAASKHAISVVLVQEVKDQTKVEQCLVYYVSEALSAAKINYMQVEKLAYAVLAASRKLKHYF